LALSQAPPEFELEIAN